MPGGPFGRRLSCRCWYWGSHRPTSACHWTSWGTCGEGGEEAVTTARRSPLAVPSSEEHFGWRQLYFMEKPTRIPFFVSSQGCNLTATPQHLHFGKHRRFPFLNPLAFLSCFKQYANCRLGSEAQGRLSRALRKRALITYDTL